MQIFPILKDSRLRNVVGCQTRKMQAMTKNFGEKNGFIWNFFDSFMLCFDRWDKPINPTDSNTTLNLSVRLILHLQSKCQINISLSNATFLTTLSLTKYQSWTFFHIPSICYNCNGPLDQLYSRHLDQLEDPT